MNPINERLKEQPDFRKLGWIKGSACIGMMALFVIFPVACTVVLRKFVLLDTPEFLAIVVGVLLMYVSISLCLWTIVTCIFLFNPRDTRYWLKQKLVNPRKWPVLIVFVIMPWFVTYSLTNVVI